MQNGGDQDKALDDQIDAVLLSNIDKINSIVDSVLESGVQRLDNALYELESTMQAGNQNASAPYVLSQVEKASSSVTEFSTAFNNFIADGPNSTHSEIIRTVNMFAGSIADMLSNTKGLTRFATEERRADQLINAARQSAQTSMQFFRALQSFRLEGLEPIQKTDVVINNAHEVQMNLQKLSKLADAFAPKSKLSNQSGSLEDIVGRELSNAANAIDAAAERLAKLKNKPRGGYSTYELHIHDSILEAALAVTSAIAQLIKAATASQKEIVEQGRGSSSATVFYKKNNRWTEGLISAAKAVASSTNTLIETSDGVLSRRNSPEQLIVASNDVAASTAQLVAASRVKANFGSKTQDRLEDASKAVGKACRSLVRQVQEIISQRNKDEGEDVDYSKLSGHEFKVREMEQQVRFLGPWPPLGPLRLGDRLMLTLLLGRNPTAGEQPRAGTAEAGRDAEDLVPGGIAGVLFVAPHGRGTAKRPLRETHVARIRECITSPQRNPSSLSRAPPLRKRKSCVFPPLFSPRSPAPRTCVRFRMCSLCESGASASGGAPPSSNSSTKVAGVDNLGTRWRCGITGGCLQSLEGPVDEAPKDSHSIEIPASCRQGGRPLHPAKALVACYGSLRLTK